MKRWLFAFILIIVLLMTGSALAAGPNATLKIGDTFDMDGVYYEVRSDGVWITGFDQNAETITFRDRINGLDVLCIWRISDYVEGWDAVSVAVTPPANCVTLVIEEGVTRLTPDMFYGWPKLRDIQFPSTLTEIGGAFGECPSLTYVNIPEGVVSIVESFWNCETLDYFYLPSTLTMLDSYSFNRCPSMGEYAAHITDDNKVYTLVNNAIVERKSGKIVVYPGYSYISDTLYYEEWVNFEWWAPTRLAMQDDWQLSIDGVFYEDWGDYWLIVGFEPYANTIVYRDTLDGKPVKVAMMPTFWSDEYYDPDTPVCGQPYSAKHLIIEEGVTELPNYMCWRWRKLETVQFPSTLTRIAKAFEQCESLKSVDIPEGVVSLADAFNYCGSLATVKLPSTLTSIEGRTFMYCWNIRSFELAQENPMYLLQDKAVIDRATGDLVLYPGELNVDTYTLPLEMNDDYIWELVAASHIRELIIPEGYETLDIYFLRMKYVEVVRLPASLAEISTYWNGPTIFGSVKRFEVDPANPYFHSEDGIVYDNAVDKKMVLYPAQHGTSLVVTDAILRNGYTTIEVIGGMFYWTKLVSVSFDTHDETVIPGMMFNSCTSLERVSLPIGLTEIGDTAFGNCISLSSIVLPPTLTTIRRGAFYNCPQLKSFVIPDSVTTIEQGALGNADGLVVYASRGSEGMRYALVNHALWAERIGATPRYVTWQDLREYPAAVVSGASGSTTKLLRSPNGASLGSYPNGTTVLVLGESGSYSRVRLGGVDGKTEGYMLTSQLVLTDELTSVIPLSQVTNVELNDRYQPLRYYVEPLETARWSSIDLQTLYGSMYVEDVLGTWYKVRGLDGGIDGYVRAQDVISACLVSLFPDVEDWYNTAPGYAVVVNPNSADRLNLRQQPDKNSTALGRYFNGTIVEMLEKGDDWCRVRVDGKEGYMMSQYLRGVWWVWQMPERPNTEGV
ncbi:hypothetical protein AGMMS49992_24120 [Clostridia bacterium]|nr:hypothetical protein AGMMS49992_24120 [Clostridia bacterium]